LGRVTEDFSDTYAEALRQSPGLNVRLPAPEDRLSDARKTELLAAKCDPLDHDGDGKKGGSSKPEATGDLASLRAEYQAKCGKRPFMGWDADALREKLANG
jgi:hypothetical protein